MKIKKTKLMNLLQLIQWAWDHEIKNKEFIVTNGSGYVRFDDNSGFKTSIHDYINSNAIFEIEAEMEIDEYDKLDKTLVITNNGEHIFYYDWSIDDTINFNRKDKVKFIYLRNDDNSIGQLIWKNGKIVEEKVD